MVAVSQRDLRGLRAAARRDAHARRCDEVASLSTICERFGVASVTTLEPDIAQWITEAYVVLTHEIAGTLRERHAAWSAANGAPTLTHTLAGTTLGMVVDTLVTMQEWPDQYELPPEGGWKFRILPLPDAWVGSQHTFRFRVDLWGPVCLAQRVAYLMEQRLFP
ncbi:MAG: hypothetical protein IT306_24850 [Chloroflexi bacterium]|nr:hypothetical protein [Chloroflexota bacterium]